MAKPLALGVITHFAEGPQKSLETVRDLGIHTVQIGYPPSLDNPEGIEEIKAALASTGIEITTVFCGFAGEDYSSIPAVRAKVGLVPEDTRPERRALVSSISEFAQKLNVGTVAAHIGFIPEDAADPRYPALVETLKDICDEVAQRGQVFALETGQETAKTLRRFIDDVARENLKVNFDPANMILYGNDNPLDAMKPLAPWIVGVHCKDGKWPTEPDMLGHEMPFGEGDVNVPLWIEALLDSGYRGPLTIEREISGEEQRKDILRAKALIESLTESAQAPAA